MCGRARQTFEWYELSQILAYCSGSAEPDARAERDSYGDPDIFAETDAASMSAGDGGGAREEAAPEPKRPTDNLEPNWNAAPSHHLIVIFLDEAGGPEVRRMQWGFIPPWERDRSGGRRPINAKIETIRDNLAAGRGMWADAFIRRRCLFPADNFYEWDRSKKPSVPYVIEGADGKPLGLAAIWSRWRHPETQLEVLSFAVLTCEANPLVAEIHDRMPVILETKDYHTWLTGTVDQAMALCVPCDQDRLNMYRVGQRVGNVRNNDASLIEPVEN